MTYTLNLNQEQIEFVINKYSNYQVAPTNNYTLFRGKIKSTALTIYKTGKLLLQGNACIIEYNEICKLLNIKDEASNISNLTNEKISSPTIKLGSTIIGSDEVGCGDYFGGIIVACCFVEKEKILTLKQLGVKDSKELKDDLILKIAPTIIKTIPHAVLLLNNEKYNEIVKIENMNLNKIKAIMHNKVIGNLLAKYPNIQYDNIVIDAFCSKDKYLSYLYKAKEVITDVNLVEKAENKYIAVASASIIARYYFLKHMDKLSEECSVTLPKGAGKAVDEVAKMIYLRKGEKFLNSIAKMNFKNTKRIK